MKKAKNNVPIIHGHLLSSIKHGFFTREGGVSKGLFTSLNCGKKDKDDAANVKRNQEIVKESLGLPKLPLLVMRQVHSAKVEVVTKLSEAKNLPEADALVTQNPDCILGVLTADCIPVLLHDPVSKTIAAIHSGWRGAYAGIIQNIVKEMKKLGAHPKDILAVMGPCITQQSYEVSQDFYDDFMKKDPDFDKYFEEQMNPEGIYFDLPRFVEDRLFEAGIKEVERLGYDTYENADLFFSCRRATHREEEAFGVQISVISLQPKEF